MKYLHTLFLLFASQQVWAEDWLCSQESSQRRGNSILACGIGTGKDENEARTQAFENAQAEFYRVCQLSEDCKGRDADVIPARTVCEAKKGVHTCQRLLTFELRDAPSGYPEQKYAKAWTCSVGGLGILTVVPLAIDVVHDLIAGYDPMCPGGQLNDKN